MKQNFKQWIMDQFYAEGHEGITEREVIMRINALTNSELIDYFDMYLEQA